MSDVDVAARGRAVEVRYGGVTALADSDFAIPAAGSTAVIGPNGAGKSTLLSIVAGIEDIAGGTLVVLNGPPAEMRGRVAFVPQATKVNDVLPVTVREVVSMGRYASLGFVGRWSVTDRRRVTESLQRLDLLDLAGRHLRELSGGQRQRVFVAQGLAQDRDLLLMDEPTASLDLVSTEIIAGVIAEERGLGHPVVVTTHDLGEARGADHVILLAGAVIAEGAPDRVLTAEYLSRAYGLELDDDGHIHIDDPAHAPTASRHRHRDGPR